MRALRYAFVVTLLSACASPYYNVMEQLGFPKRDILVDRVEEARDSQEQAAEQFKDALERFIAVTGVKGGALQEKYDQLESEYEQSEARATDVHRRVAGVEEVAEALFDEWETASINIRARPCGVAASGGCKRPAPNISSSSRR